MSLNRRKYDAEFKKNAVKLSYASPKTIKEVADDFGVSESMLYRWRQRNTVQGEKAQTAAPEEELKALRLENAVLKLKHNSENHNLILVLTKKAKPNCLLSEIGLHPDSEAWYKLTTHSAVAKGGGFNRNIFCMRRKKHEEIAYNRAFPWACHVHSCLRQRSVRRL